MTKINPILRWWVTPKLPYEDIFSGYEKKATDPLDYLKRLISMWVAHPIKRRVARIYLKILQTFTDIKVIGVTGSSGKTTTTEMLASILKQSGKTIWSKESIDAVYNIPNTILRARPSTKYLILEMSVEYPGEMDFYLWLAKPNIGIITNIFPTHTEFFGDSQGVFNEKSKLVKSLPSGGIAVLNSEDKFLSKLSGQLKARIVWFGNGAEVMSSQEGVKDFRTEFLLISNQDTNLRTKVTLPLPGRQFVGNALAASAAAFNLDIPVEKVKKGLESFSSASHRMNIIYHKSGALIVDDSYNNNPKSAIATIASFMEIAGSMDKAVVFGDMPELGTWEKKYHIELGEILGKSHLSQLICVGRAVKITAEVAKKQLGGSRVFYVESYKESVPLLKPFLKKNAAVLIKGGRSIHLEHLVEAIR